MKRAVLALFLLWASIASAADPSVRQMGNGMILVYGRSGGPQMIDAWLVSSIDNEANFFSNNGAYSRVMYLKTGEKIEAGTIAMVELTEAIIEAKKAYPEGRNQPIPAAVVGHEKRDCFIEMLR